MLKAIRFLVFIIILSFLASMLADSPGEVSLEWLGYKVDTSVAILIFVTVLFGIILTFFYNTWINLKKAPNRLFKIRRDWRRERGYKALTQGMVAVAAGDAQEARRLAKKAEDLLAEPPLTMLLSAQAAQLSGDDEAAGKFFKSMSERKDTKYLGIHGMLNQAIQTGDKGVALELAEKAHDLKPKTDNVSRTLFELQVQSGSWSDADGTTRKAIKNKNIDDTIGRRRRAVIAYQLSLEASTGGKMSEALNLAKRANNLVDGFIPATMQMARLLQAAGKRRKAASVIEEMWVKNPHPQLAEVMEELSSGTGVQETMRTIEQLASYNKDHIESHLAIAKAALKAQMWLEARDHLNATILQQKTNPSARICRYMAELEEGEKSDIESSREWLKKAAMAEPDNAWNCDQCGQVTAEWEPLCKHCQGFDTLNWRTPPRVTRINPNDNQRSEQNKDIVDLESNGGN